MEVEQVDLVDVMLIELKDAKSTKKQTKVSVKLFAVVAKI